MKVLFYPTKPKRIPRTHTYHSVSFEEFEGLMRRVARPIMVESAEQEFVLHAIAGFNSDVFIPKNGETYPVQELGKQDLGLVVEHYGVEIVKGRILPSSKDSILERARFGVIEPRV